MSGETTCGVSETSCATEGPLRGTQTCAGLGQSPLQLHDVLLASLETRAQIMGRAKDIGQLVHPAG